MGLIACGNYKHPKGAWHTATPMVSGWKLIERYKQYRNKKKWGCTCHRNQ